MQEEKKPVGGLFDNRITYYSFEDLDKFIDSLSKEQSFYLITQAIEYAFSKNVFSITETELISKSIRTLTKTTE